VATTSTTTTSKRRHSAPTVATWASQTQQLCRRKRAAIAGLGVVHITNGGIKRVGLPGVKRLLDRYLGRLLVVLREFTRRQQRIATPPSVASAMAIATDVNRESEAATSRLRSDIARAATVTEFSQAFQTWLATTQQLALRGDSLARQLNLPACQSGASASH
jgi:hypothetical protein